MATYQYEELNPAKSEIRLLHIEQSTDLTSTIEVSLSKYELENAPQYFALSYACGDENQRETIKVHGLLLSITVNLFQALHRLRSLNIPHLWADAICIQQSDNAEKSHQVQMMSRIFERSHMLAIWLGPEGDDGAMAMQLIQIWSSVPCEEILANISGFLNKHPCAFDPLAWGALGKFFQRAWWSRIWTYQEFVLSERICVLCGSLGIGFHQLRDAMSTWATLQDSEKWRLGLTLEQILCLQRVKSDDLSMLSVHRGYHWADENLRREWTGDPFNMRILQDHLHSRDATDARDKLFALLAVDEAREIEIKVDYSSPVSEVFIDYSIKCILATSSLQVLANSGVGVQKLEGCFPIPSWVPDLRSSAKWPVNLRGNDFDAGGSLKQRFAISSDRRILSCVGTHCGIVTDCMLAADSNQSNWSDFIRTFRGVHPLGVPPIQAFFRATVLDGSGYGGDTPGFRSQEKEDEFFRLVLGFMFWVGLTEEEIVLGQQGGRERFDEFAQARRANSRHATSFSLWAAGLRTEPLSDQELLESFQGPPDHPEHLHLPEGEFYGQEIKEGDYTGRFTSWRGRLTRDRRLFTTDTGYVGVGPWGMQKDDLLCVVGGSDVPLILRAVKGQHVVVGSCYVYGLMNGEIGRETMRDKVQVQDFCLI